MTEELYKKVEEYIDNDNYTCREQEAVYDAILWFHGAIWHDIDEVPKYTEGDNTANQIIVFGETRTGRGCAVASMVEEGILFAPVSGMEYKWGDCPFKKWAYVKDILTEKMLH